jgi:chromatin remodeling complex protein RSC6
VKAEPTVEVAAPVAAPVTETATASAPAAEVSSITTRMTEFSAKLQQLVSLFSSVKNDFKSLEKLVAREMKIAQKASSRKRKTNGNRKPSGFIKPTLISDELAAFLGKANGVEMARTDVSREINAYIQANDLKDKTNGRKIHPDAKLAALLKFPVNSEEELTYFNLQRYMKHHFVKAEGATA